MRRFIVFASLLGVMLALPATAQAQIVAKINLSSQRMHVSVDGSPRYTERRVTVRTRSLIPCTRPPLCR